MDGTSPAPTAPAAPDAGVLDTLPKLLLRNAAEHADRPAMRHKDFGIWQTWTWAQLRDEVRAFAIGLRKLGLERGDIGGHHRRQPPAPLRDVRGGAEPRRHSRSRLPGRGGRRDGLRARARRGEVRRRRGPGAGRQGHLHRRPPAEARAHHLRRGARASPTTIRPACIPSRTCSAWVARRCASTPAPRAGGSTRSPRATARDVSVMLYTSGTTGRPKGVMLTHDNIILSAQNGNKFDGFGPDDLLLAYLPMAWVGDHIFSYGQAYAGGHVRVLPGKPRNHRRGPPRDRPDLFLRTPARVREPAHPDHGAHGGRGLAQEAHVPVFPGRGADAAASTSSTASRSASRTGCSIGWATCWSTRRSGTAWASRARASPTPPAKRSGRSCSASTARSAST